MCKVRVVLKPFVILFLLAAIVVGIGCQSSTPLPTVTPTPPCPLSFSPVGDELNATQSTQLISRLQKESLPFANFYGNESAQLKHYTIHWFHDPDLTLDNARTYVNNGNHSAYIELGNMSPDQEAFTIAHELASIVIASKGYPTSIVYCHPQYANLTFALLQMIDTPLRDSILAQYGFDVDKRYTWQFASLFSSGCGDPSNSIDLLTNGCDYAQVVLYWEDVLGNHGVPLDIENQWLLCLLMSRAEGYGIIAIINDTKGYNTSEKARTIFRKIIDANQLQNEVWVP